MTPRGAVEDLVVRGDRAEEGTALFGEPLHRDGAALLAAWREGPLDALLAQEARHSIGNYALVRREGRRGLVVTAPGYCGGTSTRPGGGSRSPR